MKPGSTRPGPVVIPTCLFALFPVCPPPLADDSPIPSVVAAPASKPSEKHHAIAIEIVLKKLSQPGPHIHAVVDMAMRHLSLEIVQKELALTESQKTEIAGFRREWDQLSIASSEEGTRGRLARENARDKIAVAADSALELSLSPLQKERLNQIMVQHCGPQLFSAYGSLEVKHFLLSKKQRRAIDRLLDEMSRKSWEAELRACTRSGTDWLECDYKTRVGRDKAYTAEKEMRLIERTALDQIVKLLSPAQVRVLRAMQGKVIDADQFRDQLWVDELNYLCRFKAEDNPGPAVNGVAVFQSPVDFIRRGK